MNRARRTDETYEQYRMSLRGEEKLHRARCRGVFVTANAYPRWRARNDINEKGPEFREKVRAVRRGFSQKVQSHRKMGG
jgi:hypothetical protein